MNAMREAWRQRTDRERRVLAIIAALEDPIASMATLCQHAALDDIGAVAYAADIAQMAHETLTTRIFRS